MPLDTAGGEAERLLGPALAPHREKVFLSCKTGEFRKSTAAAVAQMENSLAVLQTSYFDLFQFHAVTTDADVDKILGGAPVASSVQLLAPVLALQPCGALAQTVVRWRP